MKSLEFYAGDHPEDGKGVPPRTMYADCPISRELLHWESQANTAQHHSAGQNLIHHQERGYTVLVFTRGQKKRNNVTVPFTYLEVVPVCETA